MKDIDKNISTCWNLLSQQPSWISCTNDLEKDHQHDVMQDLIELYELKLYGHVIAERFKK
jgi:hypothetical protein